MFWIYLITNLVNGKIYVGQHSGPDLRAYLEYNLHAAFLSSRLNSKPLLYRAIRKYGSSAFSISCLFRANDKQQQNGVEKFLIRVLASRDRAVGYNLAEGGTGGNTRQGYKNSPHQIATIRALMTGRPKTEEQKKKLSLAKTGKPLPAIAESNIRRRSPNPIPAALRNRLYRERQKLRSQGIPVEIVWLGRKHSDETKEKISAANKGKPKSAAHRAKLSGPRKKNPEAWLSSNKTETPTPSLTQITSLRVETPKPLETILP